MNLHLMPKTERERDAAEPSSLPIATRLLSNGKAMLAMTINNIVAYLHLEYLGVYTRKTNS